MSKSNEDLQLQVGTATLVEALKARYSDWKGAEQFESTEKRLLKMYNEFCWTTERILSELESQIKVFENGYDEMLVEGPIIVWTLCPHHLVPCKFQVTIGYLPETKVVGLSKLARIAVILGKRPVMQEEYTIELADFLESKLSPKGVGVCVVGHHGCMTCRGIQQASASVITNVLRGDFLTGTTRQEFLSLSRVQMSIGAGAFYD